MRTIRVDQAGETTPVMTVDDGDELTVLDLLISYAKDAPQYWQKVFAHRQELWDAMFRLHDRVLEVKRDG